MLEINEVSLDSARMRVDLAQKLTELYPTAKVYLHSRNQTSECESQTKSQITASTVCVICKETYLDL